MRLHSSGSNRKASSSSGVRTFPTDRQSRWGAFPAPHRRVRTASQLGGGTVLVMSGVGHGTGLRAAIAIAIAITVALVATGCGSDPDAGDRDAIVIGSFDFPESEVLAEVFRHALEAKGFPVVHRARIGDRSEMNTLLRSGDVDIVPEYLGSALEVTFGIKPSNDLIESFQRLNDAWADEGFLVGYPSPAQSQNGYAMTRTRIEALGLTTLSDLAAVAAGLTFGGPPECPQRPRCLVGLSDVYGIEFGEVVTLDAGGPATIQALRDGTVDVGLVFTSDPAVADGDLVLLTDDRGLQPVESIVPIVSIDVAERYGDELLTLIDDVSALLEQRALVQLNRLVSTDRPPGDAAQEWLLANGLIR